MGTLYALSTDSSEVADCDCCGDRPGTHIVIACGIETWVCDRCADGDREPGEVA